ncbi:MAG TPA: hypothetical protein VGK99_14560 [Acidobacteriota bacterium]
MTANKQAQRWKPHSGKASPVVLALSLFPFLTAVAQESRGPMDMPPPEARLTAVRKIAFESGNVTRAIHRHSDGRLYVLNLLDKCIWIFDKDGKSVGRLFGDAAAPQLARHPKDFEFDRSGNLLVADGPEIETFTAEGEMVGRFDTGMLIYSLRILSTGMIVVTGHAKNGLIKVFSADGTLIRSIGEPLRIEEDSENNLLINVGFTVVDAADNIYYFFQNLSPPTIRKYSPEGQLLAEWNPTHRYLDPVAALLTANPAKLGTIKRAGVMPAFTGAGYDARTGSLWFGSGNGQLFQIDHTGRVQRHLMPLRPDGNGLNVSRILFEGDTMIISTLSAGVFEFKRPE